MAIPDEMAATILAKCGRHCCICRRFNPLHLQVHHIIPKTDGGRDVPDNLIVLCLTCHSDVHTGAPFTRRFTADELKQHRDKTFDLVDQGRLPQAIGVDDPVESALTAFIDAAISRSGGNAQQQVASVSASLSRSAVRLLVEAAQSRDGIVLVIQEISGGLIVRTNNKTLCEREDPRSQAEWRDALRQLVDLELLAVVEDGGDVYRITHRGYLLADEILAAGSRDL